MSGHVEEWGVETLARELYFIEVGLFVLRWNKVDKFWKQNIKPFRYGIFFWQVDIGRLLFL